MANQTNSEATKPSPLNEHLGAGDAKSATASAGNTQPTSGPTAPFAARRAQAIFWVVVALLIAAIGFWWARAQPAKLPMWEPPQGVFAEFFEPRETNRWQRPQRFLTSDSIHSVALHADGKTALAVGDEGTVLKSLDGGQNWQSVASGSQAWLTSVALHADGKTALAVGRNGTVLKSQDGGQNWQSVGSGSTAWLSSVALHADGKTALAVGSAGTVLKSLDGGQSWQTVASDSRAWLQSIVLHADGKTALAVGDAGTALKSADGGQSWQSVVSGSQALLRSVALHADGKTALAVGDSGTALKSLDGGQNWQIVASGSGASLWSVALHADGKTALAVGDAGTALKSLDGGQSWQTVASDSRAWLQSIVLHADGKTALAVGDAGTVVKSLDGGQSWQTVASDSRAWLQSIVLHADGKTALAVGDEGTVLKSLNGAQNWQYMASGSRAWLRSIALHTSGITALAVGDEGTVLKSLDGGQSWQTVASGSKATLWSVALHADGKTALAVGDTGTVLKSGDGGQSWQTVASGSRARLRSIALHVDGKTALAVGDEGTVLKSPDGGQSWQSVASGSKATLWSVALHADGKTALAVGDTGTVLTSLDGGQSWQSAASGSQARLRSVALHADGKTALAVGDEGTVLKSPDGGQNWQTVVSDRRAWLRSVALHADGKTALAVGDTGTALKSSDGGQSWQQGALYSKSSGAWFTALLAGLAMVCLTFLGQLVAPEISKLPRLSLLFHAVTDKPVEKPSEDKLAFMPVVEALSTFLRHSATKPPLSIAINAAWGMGKSSFMGLLASSLKKTGTYPVHFNVWHHQHEEVLLAPLLQAIVNQAIPGWAVADGWRFRWRLWCERCGRWDWAFWWGSAALVSVPLYAGWLAFRTWDTALASPLATVDLALRDVYELVKMLTSGQWQASVKNGNLWELAGAAVIAVSGDLGNALTVIGVLFLVVAWVLLFTYTLRPFPASPAILMASLDKKFSLSKAEAQTDFRQRFRRHFGQVARALPSTMVVFIDDLDRCKPEKSAELLEAVNYLSEAGPCFIILGIARDIVEAQIARAHEVVAKEQAAMARAKAGVVSHKDANTDADRLHYAQKYLRKLVQLDVALPRLEAKRSIELLLGKLGAGPAAPGAAVEKTPWISPQALGRQLVGLLVLSLGAVLVWRTLETRKVLDKEREEHVKSLKSQTEPLRKEVEAARVYANWLGGLAVERPVVSASSPATAASAPAKAASAPALAASAPGSPLRYKAKADMMQIVLKDLDAGLVALEREAPEGQVATFTKLKKKAFDPSLEIYKAYTAAPQIDGRLWAEIESGLAQKAAGIKGSEKPPPRPEAGGRPDFDARRSTATGGPSFTAKSPLWDPSMGTFLGAMALLLYAIFRAKESQKIQPTPEYEAAVKTWQLELLRNPETATPRELKRFMNLSRYAIARLQTMAAKPLSRPKASVDLPISEPLVVELTAKWLSLPEGMGTDEAKQILQKDGAEDAEVALFLEIVGDLSEGRKARFEVKPGNVAGAAVTPSAFEETFDG